MDFATSFMQGFEEERKLKKSEEVRKNKAKALQDVLKSISTLMEPHSETSTSFPDIPAPTQGPTPPMNLGTPAPAAPAIGAPPAAPAGPGFFPPAPPAPVTTTNMVAPDRQAILQGALKALGGSDYAPETATAVHGLLPDFFKPPQNKVVGGKLIDESGKVIAEGHEKPSFGVSASGWLTSVHPDGTTQEHVGIKPMQTSVQEMRGKSAESVAGLRKLQGDAANAARIEAAKIVAQGGIDRVAAAAKYTKDLAKYKLDRNAQDPKTVAAYYVKLLQGYQAGDASEDDIVMMEYLRPIVEKQGLLGMLMQGGGEMPSAAPAPWKGPGPPPAAPAEKEPGWYNKLFGPAPPGKDSNTSPVPEPIKKGAPTLPGAKKAPEKPSVSGGGGFSIGGQKVLAPAGATDADVKVTMDTMQKKMKEGYSKEQLLGHLKKKGWKVQ